MKTFFLVTALSIYGVTFPQVSVNKSVLSSEYSYQYALIEASRQKMIGNINEAINLYLSCVKSNPECDVAYYELGTVYSALGENNKAEEFLAKAYKLNEKNYWYGIAYSELLKLNEKSSKSLIILKKTRKINKLNTLTIDFKIAEIYTNEGKYAKALNLLEKIEKENGVSELISFKKFEIYKRQKKYNDAENVLHKLIQKAPDLAEYKIILAEYYYEIGDTVKALESYEEAFEEDSSNIFAITNLADIYSSIGEDGKAYFFLNQAFLNRNIPVGNKIQTMMVLNKDREMIRKNSDLIEKMINSLIIEYPDNYDVKTVAYDFYNGLDNHSKALSIIKEILSEKKDDYMIWQQALYNASMLENYNELIIIGEEAVKYFPNKNELFLFIGMAYFQEKNYSKAYSVLAGPYNSIREGDEIKVQFLLFLSEAAYNIGFKQEAYNYYEQIIENDPANDLVKNNYSYYLALDSVNLLRAKLLSYSTIENSPDNSTFLDTYAWILFKLSDYETAKYYSEKALSINAESDPDIIFHYAEILFALKDMLLSEKYYKIAFERGYDKSIIKEKLKHFSNEK